MPDNSFPEPRSPLTILEGVPESLRRRLKQYSGRLATETVQAMQERLALENALREAVRSGQLRLHVRGDDGDYTISGQKMWLTNGGSSTLVAALVRTDEGADKPHRNLTAFLVEKPAGFGEVVPGLTIPGKLDKLGYKGIDTTELIFDGYQAKASDILGEAPGQGFFQMMDGVEVGRVNVSARACGVGVRAFELAVRYAQQRTTFGKPIAEHQAIAFQLAEMATKVEAAHLMMVNAARLKDSGERNDVAAGMAKFFASEVCAEVTQQSFRIHGGYGYSKEYEIERLMRDAPFLLIGEGTSEIQKNIISKRLLADYRV